MFLHDLSPKPGSNRNTKRLGRGTASGQGTTSGKGNKGQKSRSGYNKKLFFEGGQMPLSRRVPKRGFTNAMFRKDYSIVNFSQLEDKFNAGDLVDKASLVKHGVVKSSAEYIKVLADGELTKKLNFKVDKVSATAEARIKELGGSIEINPLPAPVVKNKMGSKIKAIVEKSKKA